MMLETGRNNLASLLSIPVVRGVCGSLIQCKKAGHQGFTLIELLIVMLIISVMIAVATLTLKRDYHDLLAQEGNRLKALVALARDEALFQARSLGIRFSENGYDFVIRSEVQGSWESPEEKLFRHRVLPRGVKLEVFRNQTAVDLGDGGNNRDNDGKNEETITPNVFILSTGEITPFQVDFIYPARARLALSFDAFGRSTTTSDEEF